MINMTLLGRNTFNGAGNFLTLNLGSDLTSNLIHNLIGGVDPFNPVDLDMKITDLRKKDQLLNDSFGKFWSLLPPFCWTTSKKCENNNVEKVRVQPAVSPRDLAKRKKH